MAESYTMHIVEFLIGLFVLKFLVDYLWSYFGSILGNGTTTYWIFFVVILAILYFVKKMIALGLFVALLLTLFGGYLAARYNISIPFFTNSAMQLISYLS